MLPEQLAMVPSIVIQRELMSRYDHAIFHGFKERPVEGAPFNHIKAWGKKGDLYRCIGLSFAMMHRCQQDIDAAGGDVSTDDL
jgi:hypothetical protein